MSLQKRPNSDAIVTEGTVAKLTTSSIGGEGTTDAIPKPTTSMPSTDSIAGETYRRTIVTRPMDDVLDPTDSISSETPMVEPRTTMESSTDSKTIGNIEQTLTTRPMDDVLDTTDSISSETPMVQPRTTMESSTDSSTIGGVFTNEPLEPTSVAPLASSEDISTEIHLSPSLTKEILKIDLDYFSLALKMLEEEFKQEIQLVDKRSTDLIKQLLDEHHRRVRIKLSHLLDGLKDVNEKLTNGSSSTTEELKELSNLVESVVKSRQVEEGTLSAIQAKMSNLTGILAMEMSDLTGTLHGMFASKDQVINELRDIRQLIMGLSDIHNGMNQSNMVENRTLDQTGSQFLTMESCANICTFVMFFGCMIFFMLKASGYVK